MRQLLYTLFCISILSFGYCDFFTAERVALDFNLVNLVEKKLENHCLDVFPKGAECRSLLAKVAFLKSDFKEAYRQLKLTTLNDKNYGIFIFCQWIIEKKGCVIPLFESNDVLSKILINWVNILNSPIESPRWASFWFDLRKNIDFSTWEFLYYSALEIKLYKEGSYLIENFVENNNNDDLIKFIPILFSQKYFKKLDNLLDFALKEAVSIEKKGHYLFWFFRVKKALNEPIDDVILNVLKQDLKDIQLLNIVFSEWLHFTSDQKQKIKGLKRFYKLYKRKQKPFYCYYLSILLSNCYIELGQYEKVKYDLLQLIKIVDETLLSCIYELLAKNECLKDQPDYRCAADYLEEAKALEKDPNKVFFLSKLQAELYTLLGEYDRAYCIYQELIFKNLKHFFAKEIAYEWVLCGILCKENKKELEQQLKICGNLQLLNTNQAEHLSFCFAKHQFEIGNFAKVLQFLESFQSGLIKEASIKLLCAKCLIRLNAYDKAEKLLNEISSSSLNLEEQADYYLWSSQMLYLTDRDEKALQCLEWFQKMQGMVSQQINLQVILLRAQLSAKQHGFVQAKQLLLDACLQTNDIDWIYYYKLQAADYASECGLEGQLEAIQILQSVYENFPKHTLAKEARLKQGLLLLNVKQYDLAHMIFENLLSELEQDQLIWCRFLMIKCRLLSESISLTNAQDQLEYLLKENVSIGLKLEMALQLAYIYKDQNNIDSLQEFLWDVCYPFFEECDVLALSVNEIYWLSRCLLFLAQYTPDKDVAKQIYTWMVDAQLPSASLVQQYLEN